MESIEIIFLFLISGIAFVKTLPDKSVRILGIPNRWFWIDFWSCVCVRVTVLGSMFAVDAVLAIAFGSLGWL